MRARTSGVGAALVMPLMMLVTLPHDVAAQERGASARVTDEASGEEAPAAPSAPVSGEAGAEGPSGVAPPPSPPSPSLPVSRVTVAYVENVAGLRSGAALAVPGDLTVPDGGCLRLVAERSAALAMCGPAHLVTSNESGGVTLRVIRGRGWLSVETDEGAGIFVNTQALVLRSGTIYFEASDRSSLVLLEGSEATVDGSPLLLDGSSPPPSGALPLLSPTFCAPALPRLSIPLGDPAELTIEASERRARAEAGEDETNTTESSATCVDTVDTSSATDPTSGSEGGLDPDARTDELGRVRVIVRLPDR